MLDIRTTLRTPPFVKGAGRIPYEKIARAILVRKYELSLVICSDGLAHGMNKRYRKKNYKPNVLSFPISKREGEIFLNVRKAAREALPAGRQSATLSAKQKRAAWRNRMALLFVHGCFHLKGLRHGRTMEGQEQRVLRAFHFSCDNQYTQG